MRGLGRAVAGVLSVVIVLTLAVVAAANGGPVPVALAGSAHPVSLAALVLACGALGLALGALLLGPSWLRARVLDRQLADLRGKIADLERGHASLTAERDNIEAECDLLRMRVAQLVRYAGARFDYDAVAPIPPIPTTGPSAEE